MKFGLIELIVAVSLLVMVSTLVVRHRIISDCEARGGVPLSTNYTFTQRSRIKCYDAKSIKEI